MWRIKAELCLSMFGSSSGDTKQTCPEWTDVLGGFTRYQPIINNYFGPDSVWISCSEVSVGFLSWCVCVWSGFVPAGASTDSLLPAWAPWALPCFYFRQKGWNAAEMTWAGCEGRQSNASLFVCSWIRTLNTAVQSGGETASRRGASQRSGTNDKYYSPQHNISSTNIE